MEPQGGFFAVHIQQKMLDHTNILRETRTLCVIEQTEHLKARFSKDFMEKYMLKNINQVIFIL